MEESLLLLVVSLKLRIIIGWIHSSHNLPSQTKLVFFNCCDKNVRALQAAQSLNNKMFAQQALKTG